MLSPMLDWRIIWGCLMRVPVRHWRVLFHYLCRLDATYRLAREEGRSWVNWHLREDGVIWVSAWEELEHERRARGELPDWIVRTPWTRLESGIEAGILARFAAALACTRIAPSPHRGRTLSAPLFAPLVHHTHDPP